MSRIGAGGLHSEINVTPLVDVVLVLLILFMVIVPATMRGYDVDIPGTSEPRPTDSSRRQIVLAVDLDGQLRLDDDVVEVAELGRRTAEIFSGRPAADRVLFLAADDGLNYERVMRILDAAKANVVGLRVGMVAAH